jgi:hypothetical protein
MGVHERVKSKVVKLLPVLPNSQIANRIGCSRERVRQIRFLEQTPSPYPHLKCDIMSEEQVAEVAKLNEIMTLSEIERNYGIPIWRVTKCVKMVKGKAKRHLNYNQKVTPEKIIPLFEQKLRSKKIAEILGVHWVSVSRWKKILGFTKGRNGNEKRSKKTVQ